jgi:hypothetical protein
MTDTTHAQPVYHPAVDRILTRHLGDRAALATIRRTAHGAPCDPLTALLDAAALTARERTMRLAREIKHALCDLQAAQQELAEGRPAEHLLTAHHDHLLVLANRHHDAVTHLETLARAWADARPAHNETTP